MKKINSILAIFCLLGLISTSCMKDTDLGKSDEQTAVTENVSTAQQLNRNKFSGNSFEGIFQLASNVGHKSADCGGKCRYVGGVYIHADCQSFGSVCSLRASVSISYTGIGNKFVGRGLNDYEPTDAVDFDMPARSFYLGEKANDEGYCWLNIPAQILQRDPVSHQFIYNEITYSKEQKFPNL